MMRFYRRYEVRLALLFIVLLLFYLAVAYFILAPRGYYGTVEQPRFADPWLARGEVILDGGLLYRDVFTSTPPLTNFLFLVPVLFSRWFGHMNPWATGGFMVFFSLFSLFTAFVLLAMAENRREGFETAVIFLLNPLVLGNTVLRRQDESVVVLFVALAVLLFFRNRHGWSAITIGTAMLIKLTGAVFLPIALLHSRKWQYVVIPIAVFFIGLFPFLLLAGEDAILWDTSKRDTEHPFQFDGVSLGRLWNSYHAEEQQLPIAPVSALFVAGVGLTAAYVAWKRFGVLEDFTILVAVVLLLSPKLHTGYFTFLAFSLAPLAQKYRILPLYFAFGGLAIVADLYKWPVENFPAALVLMLAVSLLLMIMLVRIVLLARPRIASVRN